jgi:hypothetical protein
MRLPLLALAGFLVLVPLIARAQPTGACEQVSCIYLSAVGQLAPSEIRNPSFELGDNGDWEIDAPPGRTAITTDLPAIAAHTGQ